MRYCPSLFGQDGWILASSHFAFLFFGVFMTKTLQNKTKQNKNELKNNNEQKNKRTNKHPAILTDATRLVNLREESPSTRRPMFALAILNLHPCCKPVYFPEFKHVRRL